MDKLERHDPCDENLIRYLHPIQTSILLLLHVVLFIMHALLCQNLPVIDQFHDRNNAFELRIVPFMRSNWV